jgi:hypothetical protein
MKPEVDEPTTKPAYEEEDKYMTNSKLNRTLKRVEEEQKHSNDDDDDSQLSEGESDEEDNVEDHDEGHDEDHEGKNL